MRIHELIDRYLKGTITPQEANELKKLIDSREHDSVFDETMLNEMTNFFERDFRDSESSPTDESHARRFANVLARIESSETKIIPMRDPEEESSPSRWRWIAAAAVLLIGASVVFYQGYLSSPTTQPPQELITYQGLQVVNLPDGSQVILNRDAKISYTSDFGKAIREVTLVGEASFDVAHDSNHRFIVHAGEVTTTVLGTAFNVRQDNGSVVVTVTRGKVQVDDAHDHTEILTPNQQISTSNDTQFLVKKTVVAENALEWQNDFLLFNKTPMDLVARELEEKFGVTVTLSSPELKNCKLNANFIKGESLVHILSVVSRLVNGDYKIDGKKVYLSGSCEE